MTTRPLDIARCFDCADHGHPATEHCWNENDTCRCGETPVWEVAPTNPCDMAREDGRARS